jgi:predicted amidohydrolase
MAPGAPGPDHAGMPTRLSPPAIAAVAGLTGADVEAGLRWVERTTASARAAGARLVVFPETALGGYPVELPGGGRVGTPPALRLDGPELARLVRAAGPTTVCLSFSEAGEGGAPHTARCA